MAGILAKIGTLPAVLPRDEEKIETGKIYVAPSDRHMVIAGDSVHVYFGPRENLFRPAIDPLFRSAAEAKPQSLIGILLSGGLDDGCSGLDYIKKHGGVTIVQDPDDALVPNLPLNALRLVEVDYKLPANKIAEVILAQLGQPHSGSREAARRDDNGKRSNHMSHDEQPRRFDGITCPECSGPIFEQQIGRLQFRCIVGHSYSPGTMRTEHARRLENALWSAIAGFEEHATILRRLAAASDNGADPDDLVQLQEEAQQQEGHARELRAFLAKVYDSDLRASELPPNLQRR
jgi:two-component system chemotaxis response regulator CheB